MGKLKKFQKYDIDDDIINFLEIMMGEMMAPFTT